MNTTLFGQAPHVNRRLSAREINRFRDRVWSGLMGDTTGHLIMHLPYVGSVMMLRRSVANAAAEDTGMEDHGHRDAYDGGYTCWGFTGPA